MSKKSNVIRVMEEEYDSTSDSDYVPNEEEENSDTSDYEMEEEESMDEEEYQKLLYKMYPSKYMKNKVNNTMKCKQEKEEPKKNVKSKKKVVEEESESSSEDEEDELENKTFNVVFTIKSKDQEEDTSEEEDSEEEEEEEEEDEEPSKKGKDPYEDIDSDTERSFLEIVHSLKEEDKEAHEECVKQFSKYIDKSKKKREQRRLKEEAKKRKENIKTMKRLIFSNKEMNDYKYFKELDLKEQEKLILKMKDIQKEYDMDKPYHITLIDSSLPIPYKAIAMRKINVLKQMEPGSNEYYKIKQWVDTFMRIPFGVYKSLPVHINDGLETCHNFMENSKKILDDAVYGLNDAKLQLLQHLGNLITNPSAVGTAIAIKGPMGTGKTTLVKEGISKILNRPFEFIALGGATDSSYLEGHSYTYEGSIWGKIVDILIRSKCMNPVIYFDELDKVSDTPRGEEIIGILTHLTDTTQNTGFHDKYFSDIDFDLSKAIFIFSYNHEEKINPILKDRMYRIQTKGYNTKDKVIIAKTHLIPKIEKNIGFKEGEIIIQDEILEYIIQHTEEEKGVRNLKRCLEIIFSKINLYRLMKPNSNLFDNVKTIDFQFPLTLTSEIITKLIQKKDVENESFRFMYS